jgi:hypothetical protein
VEKNVRPASRDSLNAPAQRLDEVKVETLRAWGEGLQVDTREELRAAGRAITMLVEEIERLNIDLWHARTDDRADATEPVTSKGDEAKVVLPTPLPAF